MTGFVDPSRFVSSKRPLWVSESRTGPTTTVRELGVVGIATSAVARVSIENVNGSVNQVELVATPLGPYRFFAAVGEDRSTIPGTVRAYDSKGALVAEHKVFTKPLCPRSNPGCIG